MKKIKLGGWVALLTSVVLLGSSTHVTNAEEVVATYAADEESGNGTPNNTATTLTSLSLGDTDQNGNGWNYVASTHTLNITSDVTVAGERAKIIESTTDLTINVAENATLTVKNGSAYGIYAGGDLVLDGAGTINVETASGSSVYGIYAGNSITISNIHLSVKCQTNYQAICANGGSLVIDNAYVYATGECLAGTSASNSVSVLGKSVVNIENSQTYGLRGNEYTFSDEVHVRISSDSRPIGNASGLNWSGQSATDYYWYRTDNNNNSSGWKTNPCPSTAYINFKYFEYIGSAHFTDDFKQDSSGTSHSKTCSCATDSTTVTMECSGGEATCTQRAVCSVCGNAYGAQTTDHDFNEYHVCKICGAVKDDVVATVTAGSEKRGYMEDDIKEAIAYAINHRGSVVKLLSGLSADSITINDSKAKFTVDLNGQKISNGWTVTNGAVTITDSSENASGEIYSVTVNDNATVFLKSGNVSHIVDVKGGVFNVDGGTIATIHFNGGQINWNSATATVTGDISYNDKSNNIMVMNAVPSSTLNIKLDASRDLSQPFASVKSGITLTDNIFSIGLWFDAYKAKYNLETEMKGKQLFARFPLNQTNSNDQLDITLDPSSYVYDGSAKEPKVTVTRNVLEKYTDGSPSAMKDGTLQMGKDFTVSYTDNTNAGTAKVTIKGIGCYTGSVERTFTIGKATWKMAPVSVDMSDRTYSCHKDNADQVDLTAYLPKNCGTVTATVTTSGGLEYIGTPTLANGVLSFTTQESTTAQSGTITITVSTTNYKDFTITVPVETKNLGIVRLKDGSGVALVNDTLTEGEKLSKLTFKDAVFVDEANKDTEVPGTLSWQTPDAVPAFGTTSAQWVFQPKDAGSYAPLSGSVAITVQKKSDTGSGDASSGGGSIGGGGGGGAAAADPKTDDPKQDDTKTDDKTDDTKQNDKTPASKGTKLKTSSGVTYQVTSASAKAPKVTYRAAQKKAKGTVTVPKTVTIKGVRYQVTAIAAGAFSGCKNVKHIVIPSSITAIGKNAFADCAKLKTITINTTKLSSRNVADGAFDNIADGTVIRVPKRMLAKYQKLFEKKGLSSKVKLVAIKAKKK